MLTNQNFYELSKSLQTVNELQAVLTQLECSGSSELTAQVFAVENLVDMLLPQLTALKSAYREELAAKQR